jgi:hypothetical protein
MPTAPICPPPITTATATIAVSVLGMLGEGDRVVLVYSIAAVEAPGVHSC